jgi:hypothetical protein
MCRKLGEAVSGPRSPRSSANQEAASSSGLPAEPYRLTVNVKGHHLSPKNASVGLLNGSRLLGAVREDISGLRLLLGPGPQREQKPDAKFYGEYNRRRNAPSRGAPPKKGNAADGPLRLAEDGIDRPTPPYMRPAGA